MSPNVGPKECTLYVTACKLCGNKFFQRNLVGGGGLCIADEPDASSSSRKKGDTILALKSCTIWT